MINAAMFMLIGAGISAAGSIASVRTQQAAANRMAYRYETESKMAVLAALQEETARNEIAKNERANNLAYQSIAGYADSSMSFLNINKQVESARVKDIADIRLMGKSVQNKYQSELFESKARTKALTFGGYASAITSLTNGYGNYKYFSTDSSTKKTTT
jgi:hypothetical protein